MRKNMVVSVLITRCHSGPSRSGKLEELSDAIDGQFGRCSPFSGEADVLDYLGRHRFKSRWLPTGQIDKVGTVWTPCCCVGGEAEQLRSICMSGCPAQRIATQNNAVATLHLPTYHTKCPSQCRISGRNRMFHVTYNFGIHFSYSHVILITRVNWPVDCLSSLKFRYRRIANTSLSFFLA